MAQKQDVENLLQQSKKKLDKVWSKDSNRLYQIKARLLTGEKLDKKTIEELVAVCKNENPGQIENHLSSGYVGGMLRDGMGWDGIINARFTRRTRNSKKVTRF